MRAISAVVALAVALSLFGCGGKRMAAGAPVEFSAADGHRLRGVEYGAGARWVILVHGDDQDSRAWRDMPALISADGFRVLAFDRSGHGASADVAAALDFARAHGGRRLYLVAAGTGAGGALIAATRYPSVRALIALSPAPLPAAASAAPETRAPKLIIVGSLDDRAEREADALFDRSIGWVVLNSHPVAAQGTDLLRSAWGNHVREQILAFLHDYYFDTPS